MGGNQKQAGAPKPAKDALAPPRDLIEDARTTWAGAKDVFYLLRMGKRAEGIKSIDDALKPLLPLADLRLAISVIIISGILTAFLALVTTYESMQLANFAADALTQVTGIGQESLTWSNLLPIALFQFLLYVPINLVVTLAYEGLAFGILKVTGGKGTFPQHLYMASVVGLSMAFASVLSLFAPLPCLQIVAGIALIIVTLYLLLYVEPKAYMMVHDVSFWHAVAVTVILTIPKLIALAFITNALAMLMGFPAPINYPGGA